ncbi:gamma-glutamylcyclotransferase family protein [Desulfogranum japonicum]|uniref:gamma-glutamylcyclotransferase family protein n=1 Tax=Desulfogranum japonicum TaxID=231447 RepID=UPI0003F98B72|nr:gamma-glutamylcyclotransferase family protein [Desulfogranum japonicum]
MSHVFTYGSLMFPQVWNRVVQGRYNAQRVALRGFERKCVKGEEYPVIHPVDDTWSLVQGVLYRDVGEEDLQRLDVFEGEYYQRQTRMVMSEGGYVEPAEVYVVHEDFTHIIDHRPWDVERFKEHGIQKFLQLYVGFERNNS